MDSHDPDYGWAKQGKEKGIKYILILARQLRVIMTGFLASVFRPASASRREISVIDKNSKWH